MCTYYSDSLENTHQSQNCSILSQTASPFCSISRLSDCIPRCTLLDALPSIQPNCMLRSRTHTQVYRKLFIVNCLGKSIILSPCAGDSLMSSTQRALSLGGPMALLIRAVLGEVYKGVADSSGVKSGYEFIAAAKVWHVLLFSK